MSQLITPQMRGAIFQKAPKPEAYVHQNYPSVRYHLDGRTCTVRSEDEDLALGKDWGKTPFAPAPKPPVPVSLPKMSVADVQRELKSLQEMHEELRNVLRDKSLEILELRAELARHKAHPETALKSENAEALEEHKGKPKKAK